ncbi:unnamed protein product [Rhizopus stolonifer]
MSSSQSPIDTFFSENSLDQWTFYNFNAQYINDHPGAKLNHVFDEYKKNLKKIRRESNSREVKVQIGKLLKGIEGFKPKQNMPVNIENHGDRIVVGINYGSVVAQEAVSNGNKKIKTNHTDNTATWEINNEEDLWDAWRQYMESCSCHEFCPEKYHVIECGYSIKCSSQTTEALYDHLGTSVHKIKSPFQSCPQFTFTACNILKDMTESNWRETKKHLSNIEVSMTPESTFAEDWFFNCHSLFKEPALYDFLSSGNENTFNHYVVWPLMDVSINAIKPKMKLMLTEYILKAFVDEYKADGCILDQFGNEVCLLETSSTFLSKERGKLGYDHVKGTFGALTLFNAIFKKYNSATLETALNLTVALFMREITHCTYGVWSFALKNFMH